ncbi:hypothetical protein E8L99_02095 [Phreatobacter aquaticus]|uniref:Flagellar hook-length control protein-like C-terminal domain-containing protein n=1 Tax=Phreatobacter aquaticus TaxID=2570229 RepID=A0A4D7QFS1_9HYPH|nr:flagellar hook-length control protein FliK [Phreatobacter aquaticus]QCK84659.1 hypothetical protein E8L99_02095 [Phreatobacter aquaticus]
MRAARQAARADQGSSSFADALAAQDDETSDNRADRATRATARRSVAKPEIAEVASGAVPAAATDKPADTDQPASTQPKTAASGADDNTMPEKAEVAEDAKAVTEPPVDAVVVAQQPVQQQPPTVAAPTLTGAPAEATAEGEAAPAIDAAAPGPAVAAPATAEGDAAIPATALGLAAASAEGQPEPKAAKPKTEAPAPASATPAASTTPSDKAAGQAEPQVDATKASQAAAKSEKTETSQQASGPAANATTEQAATHAAPAHGNQADAAATPSTSTPVPQHTAGPLSFAGEVAQRVAVQTAASASTVPINTLAVTIAARASAGSTRFDLKLDPPELGRIDVTMTLDREGRVKSKIVVEKQETLELLQRDQRNLERALGQAGVNTADSSMEFSLKDQSNQGSARDQSGDSHGSGQRASSGEADQPNPIQSSAVIYARLAAARGGVDIRI